MSVEDIDGKTVLAIWVPTGPNRPDCFAESVVAKNKSPLKYYIRSKASTVEAKGETLDEVRVLQTGSLLMSVEMKPLKLMIFLQYLFMSTLKLLKVNLLTILQHALCLMSLMKWTC